MWRPLLLSALFAVVIGLSPSARADHVPDQEATVVRVVDGDTIDVELGEGGFHRVRIIGIDTPETRHPRRGVECFGPEASAITAEWALGALVYLEREVSDTDRFGRLVRHVWIGEELLAWWLLQEGYARAYPFRPDVGRAEEFAAIEAAAWEAGAGLWGACEALADLSDLDEPVEAEPPLPTEQPAPAAPTPTPVQPTLIPSPTPEPTPTLTLPIGSRTGRPVLYDPSGPDRDCGDFPTWADAQDFYEAAGGPERDPHRLDADNDGIACESLPGAPKSESVAPPSSPTPAPSGCCRICRTGKACGNTCIARDRNCNVGPGCACNAADHPELVASAAFLVGADNEELRGTCEDEDPKPTERLVAALRREEPIAR